MKKMLPFLLAGFFIATILNTPCIYADTSLIGSNENSVFEAGNGTAENPYQITTIEELDAIRDNLDKDFLLMKNLDFNSDRSYDNPSNKHHYITGKGWKATGCDEEGTEFTGSFDGQGYSISNLFANHSNSCYSSLFGYLLDAEISHLRLINVYVTGAGSFAGHSERSSVFDCHATGEVVSSFFYVGGLIGRNNGSIINCHVSVDVTGDFFCIGGLVGLNDGVISACSAQGDVTGYNFKHEIHEIGGLVGGNIGSIMNSNATGDVTGNTYVGGLVGANWHNISYCHATGKVTHVWHNYGHILFGRRYVGRLTGADFGTTSNSYATGKIGIKLFAEGLFWHILYQLLPDPDISKDGSF
jgi:GLUG motif-containing protein